MAFLVRTTQRKTIIIAPATWTEAIVSLSISSPEREIVWRGFFGPLLGGSSPAADSGTAEISYDVFRHANHHSKSSCTGMWFLGVKGRLSQFVTDRPS